MGGNMVGTQDVRGLKGKICLAAKSDAIPAQRAPLVKVPQKYVAKGLIGYQPMRRLKALGFATDALQPAECLMSSIMFWTF